MPLLTLLPYSLSKSIIAKYIWVPLHGEYLHRQVNNQLVFSSQEPPEQEAFICFKLEEIDDLKWIMAPLISIIFKNVFMGKHCAHYLRRDRCSLLRLIGLKTNQFGLFRKYYKQKLPLPSEYVSKGHHKGKLLKRRKYQGQWAVITHVLCPYLWGQCDLLANIWVTMIVFLFFFFPSQVNL